MKAARDKDGTLAVFIENPVRIKKNDRGTNYWTTNGFSHGRWMYLYNNMFPDLKWEDEPINVELNQVFSTREYNMLNLLKKAYDIAEEGSNPFMNDAGGSSFCSEIKHMIEPIIKRIEKDIDDYGIKELEEKYNGN